MKIDLKERLKAQLYTYAAVLVGLISSVFIYSLDLRSLNFWLTGILALLIVTFFEFFVLSVINHPSITPSKFLFRIMFVVVAIQTAFGCIYYFAANSHSYLLNNGGPVKQFSDCMYFSAITLFTVGYGDIVPVGDFRFTAVAEVYGGTLFIFSFFTWGLSIIANRSFSK